MPYFRDLRDKDSVEWVAMDMYHVYRQVVRATLPQARGGSRQVTRAWLSVLVPMRNSAAVILSDPSSTSATSGSPRTSGAAKVFQSPLDR